MMKSKLFLFLFLLPCLCDADGDSVFKKKSLCEGVPPPPLHSSIFYKMMACDIAFIGRLDGLETNQVNHFYYPVAPCFSVDQVLIGECAGRTLTAYYFMIDNKNWAMNIMTNDRNHYLVFAMTNDWWMTEESKPNDHCPSAHIVNAESWAIVSNSAPAPYLFRRYTLYPNERSVIPIDGEDDEKSIALVTNLIHVARVERNRQKFVDMIDAIYFATNRPPTPSLQRELWRGAWILKLVSLPK